MKGARKTLTNDMSILALMSAEGSRIYFQEIDRTEGTAIAIPHLRQTKSPAT